MPSRVLHPAQRLMQATEPCGHSQELPFCWCPGQPEEGPALVPAASSMDSPACPPALPVPLCLQNHLEGSSLVVQAPVLQVSLFLLLLCSSRLPRAGRWDFDNYYFQY